MDLRRNYYFNVGRATGVGAAGLHIATVYALLWLVGLPIPAWVALLVCAFDFVVWCYKVSKLNSPTEGC